MKTNIKTMGLRLPDTLLRKLDKAAKAGGRTRSSEARRRLEQSLMAEPKQAVRA